MDLNSFWSQWQHFQAGILIGREALYEWRHTTGFGPTWCWKVKMKFSSGRGQNWIPFLDFFSVSLLKDATCRVSERLQQAQQVFSPDRVTDLSACACHTGVVCVRRLSLRVSMVTVKLHLRPGSLPDSLHTFWICCVSQNESMKQLNDCMPLIWLHATITCSNVIIWSVGLEVRYWLQRSPKNWQEKESVQRNVTSKRAEEEKLRQESVQEGLEGKSIHCWKDWVCTVVFDHGNILIHFLTTPLCVLIVHQHRDTVNCGLASC